MISGENSELNKILVLNINEHVNVDVVEISTLTRYCKENNIKNISYLKIDTEGFDLQVLKSGETMLRNHSIDFIEIEVGMNPANDTHVPWEEIKKYMENMDYYLFGIYDQIREWKLQKPYLRRSNLVFLSKTKCDVL